MRVGHEIDFDDVKDLQDGRMRKRVNAAIAFAVRDGLNNLEEHHKKKYFLRGAAASPKTHPTKITWRTGSLAKNYTTYWKEGNHYGYYGSTLKRARLLEVGDTIRPTKKKALAIPTPAARVGVGAGLAQKDYPKGELFRPNKPGGGKYPWLASNVDGKFKILFILAMKAEIPARPTVAKTAKDRIQPFQKLMTRRVMKAMETK